MTRWQTTIGGSDAICWGSFVTPTYELVSAPYWGFVVMTAITWETRLWVPILLGLLAIPFHRSAAPPAPQGTP